MLIPAVLADSKIRAFSRTELLPFIPGAEPPSHDFWQTLEK